MTARVASRPRAFSCGEVMDSQDMPPPPPRQPSTRTVSESDPVLLEAASSLSALSASAPIRNHDTLYGSSPTQSQLTQRGIEDLAKATGPVDMVGSSDESRLGKSLDSVSHLPLTAENDPDNNLAKLPPKRYFRRRAESFDERKMPSHTQATKVPQRSCDDTSCNNSSTTLNDPTIEMVLISQGSGLTNFEDELQNQSTLAVAKSLIGMGRSTSCGLLPGLLHPGV
eukprot:CAMPEP_0172503874 /NCGR_PEP_ID=MMETSP1066-20121228/173225_1 /TAXON_ID=671091 /ORGANISM="Coscinodiscus wailesii, Strain CCMP2513" /LENGTH=225 /DNA_ID=CAMNT_0013279793 /DNA_START=337 /DNA_END=1011 /DNA_ORIENTATION=-